MVDGMIRRSVRARFRRLYWIPPDVVVSPTIFVPNHHGWHDGYVMYHALTALNLRFHDWIAEYDAFPMFGKVGGMPFPENDLNRRTQTIRKTMRLMAQEKHSLLLFAEQHLHRGPQVWPMGRALELLAEKVPGVQVVPVAVRYDLSIHERPECYLKFGKPVEGGPDLPHRTRLALLTEMDRLETTLRLEPEVFQVLAKGTLDVNERWDVRRIRQKK